MKAKILLGYELKTAKPVHVGLHHLIITGMTQLSGKTTTLEALLSRSKLTALTFRTKRGELGFENASAIQAYFDDKGLTHWRALEGLLSATLEEKVQREPGVRGAIIRLCSGSEGLQDIYHRNEESLEDQKIKGFMRDVHTKIKAYLDLVLPQLRSYLFAQSVDLKGGLNMMDLEGMSDELQALVIFATTEWIYRNNRDTVLVMPEALKFLPQDRGSPTKVAVEKFVREGAAIGNYLWIDSQDLRGVDKKFLRQIDNWILGRQRDPREIESTIQAIPLPKRLKPEPEEIMQLEIGHFIACLHDEVRRVYVQPAWLDESTAKQVALGKMKPQGTPAPTRVVTAQVRVGRTVEGFTEAVVSRISELEDFKEATLLGLEAINTRLTGVEGTQSERDHENVEKRIKALEESARSLTNRTPVNVQLETPAAELTVTPRVVKLGLPDTDLRAQLCVVMLKHPEETWTVRKLADALEQHGWRNAPPNIVKAMRELVGLGLCDTVQSGTRVDYRLVREKIKLQDMAK